MLLNEWVDVGLLGEVPVRGARVVEAGARRVAMFRTSDDQVFALDDRCPHLGGPLSEGIVSGHTVTCPLHAWRLELETGEALGPDVGCSHRHDTRVVDDVVQLRIRT